MKLSYSWLKQLVNFSARGGSALGGKESPEKLAELLAMHVANVEKVEKLGQGLAKVIVAEITEIKPHLNADKLKIAIVKTQSLSTQAPKCLTIVCGAPNIKVGQKVPLALPGTKLLASPKPSGEGGTGRIELKASTIRGVKSEGMLCAEDELGIGLDHTGIYILPLEVKIGEPVAKVLGLDDTILEIENKSITHRPDLFSHLGFAREIAAVINSKLKTSASAKASADRQNSKPQLKTQSLYDLNIKIEDFQLCPRYMGVVMDGIKIGPSPIWMQNRLRNLGIRPINNIVDITNYVLAEYGQPLHAFDFNKLNGSVQKSKIKNQKSKTIIIRRAYKGEKLLALDGKEYELNENDLVITNSQRPIALAGVMGGELFSIVPNTKAIVIESANFDPVTVRRTSWRLGLRTESALRFEKGLPINFPEEGMKRAIELVQELAGGRIVSQIYDLKSKFAQEKLIKTKKIKIDFNRINKVIGLKIEKNKILSILKSLGFGVEGLTVEIPVFRPDIEDEQDLVEEIIRIYGCGKISPWPIIGELKPVEYEPEFILERELRNILVGCGFDEVYNYSFYSGKTIDEIGSDKAKHLAIANPLNPEQEYLRASLIAGLMKNAEKNSKNFSEFKIFEIGRVFYKPSTTNYELSTNMRITNTIQQPKRLAGLVYPKNLQLIKGIVELIFDKLGIGEQRVNYETRSGRFEVLILVDNKIIGSFDSGEGFSFFEIDFASLLKSALPAKKYQPISIYPPIKRDLAFLIKKKITWQEIFETVKDINPLIKQIELFDVFEDKKFGGKRNLAFHIIYQSDERTLKTEEVDKIQQKIIQTLKEKFGAELRTF